MKLIALGAAVLALSSPVLVHAQPLNDENTVAVSVRTGDLDLNQPQQAAVALDRVNRAALEACGASDFSIREYRQVVQTSACYRENVQGAVAALGSPTVSRLYNHGAKVTLVGLN